MSFENLDASMLYVTTMGDNQAPARQLFTERCANFFPWLATRRLPMDKIHQPQGKKHIFFAPRNGRGERGGYGFLKKRLISWVNPRFFFAGTALGRFKK